MRTRIWQGKRIYHRGVFDYLKKICVSDMTFQTDPEDAAVCVYDSLGNRVMSDYQPECVCGFKRWDTIFLYGQLLRV